MYLAGSRARATTESRQGGRLHLIGWKAGVGFQVSNQDGLLLVVCCTSYDVLTTITILTPQCD